MSSPLVDAVALQRAQEVALARSVVYECLALAFDFPTPESHARLQGRDTSAAVERACELLLPEPLRTQELRREGDKDSPAPLESAITRWLECAERISLGEWRDTHGKLFGHTARGQVCPYEAEYGQEGLFQTPRHLAAITGFYAAFGLTPRRHEHERPDHISCELGFLAFLSRKEAVALELSDEETWLATRRAERRFLKEHVGRFGFAFARLLREHVPSGFYAAVADSLYEFLESECLRLEVPRGPQRLALRSDEEDGIPMACGDSSSLVQIERRR